jgi:hypothetical protein
MLVRELMTYLDIVSDDRDVGIAVFSINTGDELAVVFDVAIDISEYGELIFGIKIEPQNADTRGSNIEIFCESALEP